LFSLPVFYGPLIKEFHWTRAEAAGGGSIALLLIGILGPAVGKLADRFTAKAVLLGGMCVGAVALVLLSFVNGLAEYYAFCVLLGIGCASVSLVPTSILIAPWFRTKRGFAIGVMNAGVGVAGLIAPNLTRFVIERRGISQSFLTLAMCMAIPFVLTLVLVKSPDRGAPRQVAAFQVSEVLKMSMFWVFGFSLFFAAHTLTGIQQHLSLYLTGHGVSAANAAFALSMLLGASAVGKIIGGAIADRWSSRWSLLVSIVCLAIGIGGLLTAEPQAGVVYWIAAMFGLGYGGVFNAPSLIAFEFFGTERVGTILGLFMMFFGLGTSSGGLVAGYIFDQTKSYMSSFTLDLASAGLGFVLLYVAGRRRKGIDGRDLLEVRAQHSH
jgi:MFS family permease